ncbi:MAG: family 20 glycosylhydrolase [Sedimentisphaerales bacterium]|nr:family 20 glycosylhydrolase [Sedimentisphaerales bacterium]
MNQISWISNLSRILRGSLVLCILSSTTLSRQHNPKNSAIAVIPQPTVIRSLEGHFLLRSETVIYTDEKSRTTAEYFSKYIRPSTGFDLSVQGIDTIRKAHKGIVFRIDTTLTNLGDEGYLLNVSPEGIDIAARTDAGVFYGCQTVRQLLPPDIERDMTTSNVTWRIPCVEIQDIPRFAWRGYMLDSARHFQDKEYIKRVIDLLSLYKMNRLHWHLIDDQGWRVEIKSHPKLTEIGAFRPNANARLNYIGKEPGDQYGGFFTQDDIREIVAYAQKRYVTIVPEIEMPGHCLAALITYPELSCTGELPSELGNNWIYKDVYCPGNEKTFAFLEDVLSEVINLFPSPWIHIGGDECPKDRWKVCPKCQNRIRAEELKNESELQSYFVRRIETFLSRRGRRLIGWDDILDDGIPPRAVIQPYRNITYAVTAARKGHDVIMSPSSHCYLDYSYATTPVEKTYAFDPTPSGIPEDRADHILGVECCQWLGNVSRRHLESHGVVLPVSGIEYQTFPRLIATAEVGWSPKHMRNWDHFRQRLQQHGRRLDILGLNYYRDPAIWNNTTASNTFHQIWYDPDLERIIASNIERYRKNNVSIQLMDTKGNPLSNAEVTVEQISHDFLFGSNLFVLGQLETPEANDKYEEAFLKIFNSATIPFYWLGTEPTQGRLRYEEGASYVWRRPPPDRLVAWCKQHDIVPKGHPLLWHAHNPEWFPKDPERLKKLYIQRFQQIADRYGESIALWDGVNEPIECAKNFPLYTNDLAYVEWAFREQRKIFPTQTQLCINEMLHVCHEYHGEDETQTRYFRHIKELIDKGVQLDGIGFQFHLFSDSAISQILGGYAYSPRQLLTVYQLYDKFNLPMYVTEITIPTMAETEKAVRFQEEMVRNYYRLWFSVPRMKGITWWNLADGTAIANETRFQGGLLNKDLNPKRSYMALDELINHRWKTKLHLSTMKEGIVRFRGFHGKYRIMVKTPTLTRSREINVKEQAENQYKLAIW